ncbi:sensor histidine kinase [Fundicoccus culcitae]|uniref:GHKL domain-containing protein n=1 Tax=Fundicoccus culcitae TaxID=2969821 RepID=A0ABY5P677_9LACT|nr:GHKL domain-containing protein [Fundicoccus culcitae]UUX34247.1 GHKL domain-containing protein [Fundicoccus culcitae]
MDNLILIIILALIIISGLIGIILHQKKEIAFHKLQQTELDQYATEVELVYSQLRGIRHDYRNHLQVMDVFVESEQFDLLRDYISQLNNELNQVDTIIRTGNTLIDALVNTKLSIAKNNGITLDATAIAPQHLPIQNVDLAVIIGNVLSNAIEATTRQLKKNSESQPFIRFYLAPMQKNLYISVSNTMDKNPQNNFMSLKAPNRQGYGIRRIDQTVNKYQGHVNRQWEEGIFVTEITIPLIDNPE